MNRYHPILVGLHWLLALFIIVSLIMGTFMLAETPNSDPSKLFGLQMHMGTGVLILLLMIVRLVTRVRTVQPPHADIGIPLLNRLGIATHWLLYVIVFLMCASGIGISVLAGLPDIVFFGSGDNLPENFDHLLPRTAHGILANLLMLLVAAHIAAALYHQLVKKDGLFSRMWFGTRD